jgi:hypothetical protein
MKSFKTLDLFPKLIIDNHYKSSKLGIILSFILILLLTFLLFREIKNLFTIKIIKEIIVKNNISNSPFLNLNFRIKFYSTPCAILSLDFENLLGKHKMNIKKNIKFYRMSKDSKIIEGEYSPYKLKLLEESITLNESCLVEGIYSLEKSPADLHFSYHEYKEIYDNLKENNNNLFNKLNLSHKINKLSFADDYLINKIKKNFSSSNSLDLLELLEKYENDNFNFPDFFNDKDDKAYNYEYYFKLIPYIFYNEYTKEEFSIYLYSLTFSRNLKLENDIDSPIVIFNYDFSPICMKFVLKKNSYSRFFINISAIFGGVIVCFKILFDFLNYLLNK